jgi:hypothetical protein
VVLRVTQKNHDKESNFDVKLKDVTKEWTDFVIAGAEECAQAESPNPNMQIFYQAISNLFGGVRITATRVA